MLRIRIFAGFQVRWILGCCCADGRIDDTTWNRLKAVVVMLFVVSFLFLRLGLETLFLLFLIFSVYSLAIMAWAYFEAMSAYFITILAGPIFFWPPIHVYGPKYYKLLLDSHLVRLIYSVVIFALVLFPWFLLFFMSFCWHFLQDLESIITLGLICLKARKYYYWIDDRAIPQVKRYFPFEVLCIQDWRVGFNRSVEVLGRLIYSFRALAIGVLVISGYRLMTMAFDEAWCGVGKCYDCTSCFICATLEFSFKFLLLFSGSLITLSLFFWGKILRQESPILIKMIFICSLLRAILFLGEEHVYWFYNTISSF